MAASAPLLPRAEDAPLLSPGDPLPVEVVRPDAPNTVLLTCEHAGLAIPSCLGDLGVADADLRDHVGWDIGAAQVCRRMARRLDAAAVLQPYSRLVVDCNRPPEAVDFVPALSHGVAVPANEGISGRDRARRLEIFVPYQSEISCRIARPRVRIALSIHSFTPVLSRRTRPWDVGFLFRKDTATSAYLAETLAALAPGATIGLNEPYSIDDASDWFVPRHGEPSGVPHALVEIRNDHLRKPEGCALWADLLAECVICFLETRR
ncbi:N-formylglutamate amidohydrolase [Acuticoccus mangrovi]|uniref:N-formylglutamate amidohydrolase n=1 Tax=Acuticoccus mangrovi TaxID=2796142 RepID=A0A934ILL9_9HYPH|nr:N-formylglutamate amidohydrolase [Acuticoccus mangrovi]MBJ3774180.1 N-formylglutamate amidohydrolase [Acuticoccus mangrovi]